MCVPPTSNRPIAQVSITRIRSTCMCSFPDTATISQQEDASSPGTSHLWAHHHGHPHGFGFPCQEATHLVSEG